MTLGLAERQTDLLDELTRFCDSAVPEGSIYGLLHRERDALFPDELFADLFTDVGRRSVPPSIVATVMVLQRLEGCSDREAVDRLAFDARWRYACGLGGWDEHRGSFVHTVLVDMRARLHRSERPDRVLEVTVATARSAGLVGRRRSSTPRPCTTPWPRWTRSPCSARPSGACWAWPAPGSEPSSGRSFPETTTTPPPASHPALLH